MKHLKKFESKSKYNIGDYVTFETEPCRVFGDYVYNCVKIVDVISVITGKYLVIIIDEKNHKLLDSYIYDGEIEGFAPQERIDFFNAFENLIKYNL
jgi:uncharacterized protein YbcC (UPF0753/DUF2309 family)